MAKTQIFFVNDSSANANWGSLATTQGLYQMLQARGAEVSALLPLERLAHPSWLDRVITADVPARAAAVSRRHDDLKKLSKVVLSRSLLLWPDLAPKDWSDFEVRARQALHGRIFADIVTAIKASDVVLINGEGGVFGKRRAARMMFFIAYLAKQLAKPVAFVSHTADLGDPVLAEIAQHVYPLLDSVVVREPHSAANLHLLVPDLKVTVAADVAFLMQPAARRSWLELARRPGYCDWANTGVMFDPTQPYVCIGGSSAFSHRTAPVAAYRSLCQQLLKEGKQVVLTASAAADLQVFETLARDLALPLIPPLTPPLHALDILANAEVYIGGRWHGAIFALRGGTPVVMLSAETFKVNALLAQMELNAPVFDALRLADDVGAILKLSRAYALQGEGLRRDLKAKAEQLGQLAAKNLEYLEQTLTRHAPLPGARTTATPLRHTDLQPAGGTVPSGTVR